jgi:L-threonylcarbamoyladenylate synthase
MNDDIAKALEVLQQGGIILYPTDTIWGIGCDATNPEAVKKVYELKKREDSKSMLVLLDTDAKLPSYMNEVPEMAICNKAINHYLPRCKKFSSQHTG